MANKSPKTVEFGVFLGNGTINELEQAKIVMKNQLIRKQTKWSVTEVKLFYSALSQIKKRDENCWVKLKKRDIIEMLNMREKDVSSLRQMFVSVKNKSDVHFDEDEDLNGLDGSLIRNIRTTKKEVYVQFDDMYLPLLDELSSNFTTFYLDNIVLMKSKHAINLFTYLKSVYYPIRPIQHRQISLDDLKNIFELDETDYVRSDAKRKGWFDVTNFRKKVINQAVNDINQWGTGMEIQNVEPIRRGGIVGFEFTYILRNRDGSVRDDYECLFKSSQYKLEQIK